MKPEISVIIPTFNRAHIIPETLESVLAQTFTNWECLIIDDGSTDNTDELVEKYLHDKRFKYFKRPGQLMKGACTCRNIGINNALGNYIQFLDSDDLLAANKFEVQLKALEKKNSYHIATCKWGGLKPMWDFPRLYEGLPSYLSTQKPISLFKIFATRFTYLPVHAYLVPRALIIAVGGWKENLKINQDGEFFSRILLNCSGILFCEDTFVLYRTGSGNRTSNRRKTREGVRNYTESWEMINKTIAKKTGIDNHLFVKQARAELYHTLKKHHPEWIEENKAFLSGRTPVFIYNSLRLLSRIRDRLQVKQLPLNNRDF
ncbi:glycosyltransferase family 2 protein [Zunongwangia sp. F363]|uniref:Glycosyltransferase family 2 protein n=1 Tax=Autumnicola tepida TaxID=3075595 RepID=A0ABU3CDV4_9FLAO|nr:glycosyltransferase family 2 protein [Zunongwangia sp. F363]MDT0644510.1 glycosyltransferase family 2 protein [Zunongwangia sp. F363]